MNYEKLFADNRPLLEDVVNRVGRRHRLREEDVEELFSAIQAKLLADDYDVLRRFEGRSSLRTYFTTVVTHHLLDQRNSTWGRWRPSIYARRAGPVAVLLERLMTRDGHSFDEAVEILRTNYRVPESEKDLYEMAARFPARERRRIVSLDAAGNASPTVLPDDAMEDERRTNLAARTATALKRACDALPVEDRLLLRMHFQENLQIAAIARALNIDQKRLYRRKDDLLAALAREMAREGISREDILDITGAEELRSAEPPPGNRGPRPSSV